MTTASPPNLRTGHVGLNVSDTRRASHFYAAALGLRVQSESQEEGRRYVFLGDDERLVLTLWEQSEGTFSAGTPGLHHLSFEVDDIADVEAAEARVRALGGTVLHGGIVPHREGADSGGLFFEDPDGIRLEIYAGRGAAAHGEAPTAGAPSCGFF
jgi:catechol 2,3-dioxygenase-like lactoylglutathione lyase family enzyme